MLGRRKRLAGIYSFLLLIFVVPQREPRAETAGPSSADTDTASLADWKMLRNDLSRSDLFKRIIQARKKEESALPSGSSKALALRGPFTFPKDVSFDDTVGKPRTNSIFGIDISHHTKADLNLAELRAQGVRFVYAKATQGVGFKDGRFSQYWKALGALPQDSQVLRGAYHFLSAGSTGLAQADSFLKFMQANGGLKLDDLPPVVDLEWDVTAENGRDRWSDYQPDEILQNVLDWLQRVEQVTKKRPIVYTARSWWRERMQSDEKFARLSGYRIWIADYSRSARAVEEPGVPGNGKYHLWQFTDRAKLPKAYSATVDANIYKGTEAEFVADFQLPKAAALRN